MKPEVGKADILPSEFMRARRPALFSDSQTRILPTLSRAVFEYHLETLTSRKEETKFEYFARKLVEKEICPNLLPQTGPTGGGDSKTDTETYPVSTQIAETWYSGIDQSAAHERWAFAFSAAKRWARKARSDIKGIVDTGRGHARIFFVTNQFIADKKRALTEDKLSEEFSVSVRILDRTWVVEKVFDNDRVALAADALGLTDLGQQIQAVQGPNDTERTEALRQLDVQIEDMARYQGVPYQLAEDCLHSAILARNLERPRAEIIGRFDRAARVAERVGYTQQKLRIAYARAWTAYWWHDDFEDLNSLYFEVESFAKDSEEAEDVELLFNVWQVLRTSVVQGRLDKDNAKLESRTEMLKSSLDRLAANQSRPSNAMRARTDRLLVELTESIGDQVGIETALVGLKEAAESSENLIHYPIVTLYEVVNQLGDFLADNASFDVLLETLAAIIERRTGEGEGGKAFLQRGMQKLRADLPYEAIRYFGRAQHKLSKREYRSELVMALVGAGNAYESIGMLWAAKSSLTSAAYFALSEFRETGAVGKPSFVVVRRLAWIELQLGRVPCVLAWTELADVLIRLVEASDGPQEGFAEERQSLDMVLAMLLLRSDLEDLSQADCLVGVLEKLDLQHSQMALMYALGYEDRMRADGWIPAEETPESVRDFFWKLSKHQAADELPARAEYLMAPRVALTSNVLGCEINCSVANDLPSMFLGEGIVGGLEAFLATSLNAGVFPYRQNYKVLVDQTSERLAVPTHELLDVSDPGIQIRHSIPIHEESLEGQQKFFDSMLEIVMRISTQIAQFNDFESYMNQLAGDERALERSINNAHIESLMTTIMGPKPKIRLADWRTGDAEERFPLIRDTPWFGELALDNRSVDSEEIPPRFGEGEPPAELREVERGRHSDRKILSLIDIPLWDNAGWKGVAYGIPEGEDELPLLALAFKDPNAASAIFKGWVTRLGRVDQAEELRISILTGIMVSNPAAYRVVIGSRLRIEPGRTGHLVVASRINTMEPMDSRNLDAFVARFRTLGAYRLVPAHLAKLDEPPKFILEHWIGKESVEIRPAWKVGDNDPDLMALKPDDDPIIPSDVSDVPIVRALERIRERSNRSRN